MGVLAFTVAAWLTGCGNLDPAVDAAPECGEPLGEDFLPLPNHATWTYAVTDPTRDIPLGEKTNTILEKHGNSVKVENSGATAPAFRWVLQEGSRYLWERNVYLDPATLEPISDQYYVPARLRFDGAQMAAGSTWEEPPYTKISYDLAKCPGWSESGGVALCPEEAKEEEVVTETWTVLVVDRSMADVRDQIDPAGADEGIPAGEFVVTCQRRVCVPADACNEGTYCFARGVGKVFELSAAEREMLTSFCFPRPSTE